MESSSEVQTKKDELKKEKAQVARIQAVTVFQDTTLEFLVSSRESM